MRGKRLKQYKKSLQIYQNTFAFRPPFQILLDGTIIAISHKHKLDLCHLLPRTLSEQDMKFCYTSCVINELEKISAESKEIKEAVYFARKKYEWRSCKHKDQCLSARDCIIDMVGHKNFHKFIVCSQDVSLRKALREIAGVPLIYLKNSVVVLEPVSEATLEEAKRLEDVKMMPQSHEIESGKKEKVILKKRKRKEPNPLSCKKSNKKSNEGEELHEEAGPVKKKRGRRGAKKHSTPQEGDVNLNVSNDV